MRARRLREGIELARRGHGGDRWRSRGRGGRSALSLAAWAFPFPPRGTRREPLCRERATRGCRLGPRNSQPPTGPSTRTLRGSLPRGAGRPPSILDGAAGSGRGGRGRIYARGHVRSDEGRTGHARKDARPTRRCGRCTSGPTARERSQAAVEGVSAHVPGRIDREGSRPSRKIRGGIRCENGAEPPMTLEEQRARNGRKSVNAWWRFRGSALGSY
jgi:hypothetical protein